MSKPISIWMSEEEIKEIKKKAKEEKRSVSNLIKMKIFGGKDK